jgi:phosphatidylserine/phosphatidylglycerophosphate/cardiolipin synthase-like enzyme
MCRTIAAGHADGYGARRVVPENARPLPGMETEYPKIGRAQKKRIAEEVVASSLLATVEKPFCALTQVLGRESERVAVRGRELSTWLGSARAPEHVGTVGDGALDAPFGTPLLPARISLLPSSEAAIQGLFWLISSAEKQIDLMIYGWEDDPTGREVAAALDLAARRGVRVRLLVDRTAFLIHNRNAAIGEPTFLDRLACVPNVRLIETPGTFARFDHRKLAVMDGRVAWTGGMILTEVARRQWENLAFLVEGPVAAHYAALFEERWRDVGGATGGPVGGLSPRPEPAPNALARVVRTDVRDRTLKNALFHAIDHAKHHIYLENPYFSDTVLAAKLVAARQRGVDVRAIVTLRGNVRKLNQYVVLTSNRLLRGGVRVYLAPAMTHVKAMTVDGTWAYLGTGNFDELSLRNNREVGLTVLSPKIVEAVDRDLFLPDMNRDEELTALMPLPRKWPVLELFALWY